MPQRNLFDETADVIRVFLKLNRSQQTLQKYNWQLGAICDLIKHTHSIVVDKLEAIEATDSFDEARALVAQLESHPLTESFRANGLCDIFQGFGYALRKVIAPGPGGGIGASVSTAQQVAWDGFCESLENREREVASLYADQIQELGDLIRRRDTAPKIEDLQAAARAAKHVLTTQMADFDSLATQFQRLLKER